MSRRDWQAEVRKQIFPIRMRPVKATLLSLPIDKDGTLSAWRDDVAVITGLPVGTLKRHLELAVREGWLLHEKRGGRGRRGMYRASLPNSGPLMSHNIMNSGPEMSHSEPNSGAPTTPQSPTNSGPHDEPVNKDSANASEHEAVDVTTNDAATSDPNCLHCRRSLVFGSRCMIHGAHT